MAEMSHAFFILDRKINVCAPSCVIGIFWWLGMFVGNRSKHVEIIEVTWGMMVTHRRSCGLCRRLNGCNGGGSGGGRNEFLFDER